MKIRFHTHDHEWLWLPKRWQVRGYFYEIRWGFWAVTIELK